jgi:pimeloyl-ACP methyl ester carboxylesterase
MSELICPQFTTIDGLSIRFAESGQGSQDAILLSPWPESVYAFEQSWARLAEYAHLLAIDPPGFGKSEYREALMNPKAMGDFIVRIADAFGLGNPHIVGPDIDTSSSLSAAAQPGGSAASSWAVGAPRVRPTTTAAQHHGGAPGRRQHMMCRAEFIGEGDRGIIGEKSSGTVILGDTAKNVRRR